jgi:hydroxymethylbilane synthase
MLQNRIDFAVHSLKDLPTNLPEGLMLGCITERENPADALVVNEKYKNNKLDTLPEGSIIGTSSLRRLAQLRHHYPYLIFKDVRGNVNTRLAKLDAGEYDAIILAAAGLKRLNMDNRIHQIIPEDISLHAVGQGALGIECRAADSRILELLEVLKHSETHYRCMGERSFLRALEGGCQVPIGVTTKIECNILTLTGIVASLDGKTMLKNTVSGHMEQAENLGYELSVCLRDAGATEILDKIFSETRIQ